MRGEDFYAVLGLRPGAGRAEIDQAYRVLIKRYHPDFEGGDVGRAAEINRAYSELRARARHSQQGHSPRPAARPPQIQARSRSSWLRPMLAVAVFAAAALIAKSAILDSGPRWPRWPQAVVTGATEGRAARAQLPVFSLDAPLSTQLIEHSIDDAMAMDAADNLALAADVSRDCLSRLSSNPSLPLFDSCAAFDEAVAILAADNPAIDSGPFNPSAVTARQVGAARLLSADPMDSESRLQQIRSQVHLILLPKIPDARRSSSQVAIAIPPTPEIADDPEVAQTSQPRIEPTRSIARDSSAVEPRPRARSVSRSLPKRARTVPSAPPRRARPPAPVQRPPAARVQRATRDARAKPPPEPESRTQPAWQRPMKPAWQRPMPSPSSGS